MNSRTSTILTTLIGVICGYFLHPFNLLSPNKNCA